MMPRRRQKKFSPEAETITRSHVKLLEARFGELGEAETRKLLIHLVKHVRKGIIYPERPKVFQDETISILRREFKKMVKEK